jgi:acetyl esterase/lipase
VNLAGGDEGGEAQCLGDIYRPSQPNQAGLSTVIVHGGAFVFGHRAMKPVRFLIHCLLEQGFTVCSIDYRHLGRGARLQTSVDDVRAGLIGWTNLATEYGCDTDKVSMVGISAGATIGLLAAGSPEAPNIARLVSFYGLYELTGLIGPIKGLIPQWLTDSKDHQIWTSHSPISAGLPACPTLLIHGTADGIVPIGQHHAMLEKRQAQNLPTAEIVYDGAPHSFLNNPCAERESSVDATIRFLLEPICKTH